MASTDVFEEHLSLISALSDNYARSEDRAAVSEFLKTQNEIVGMLKRSEDMMNEHVRGLTRGVEDASARATYPKGECEHDNARDRLLRATAQAKENVNSMNDELRGLQAQRDGIRADLAALQRKGREVEEMVCQTEPQLRHQLSLYAHISRITWDFHARDRVAGTLSAPGSGDILPFDFPTDPARTVEIADKLWKLMDG